MLCHWNHRSGIDIKFSSTVNQFNNFIIIGINLKSAFFGHFRPYFLFYLIKHLFFFFISSKWTLHPYILESCEKMIHFLSFSFILIPIFGSFLSRNAISPQKEFIWRRQRIHALSRNHATPNKPCNELLCLYVQYSLYV